MLIIVLTPVLLRSVILGDYLYKIICEYGALHQGTEGVYHENFLRSVRKIANSDC
jgi:hypothetical protein